MAKQAGTNDDFLAMALIGYEAQIAKIKAAIAGIRARLGHVAGALAQSAPAKRTMSIELSKDASSFANSAGKENIRAFWLVGHSQGGMTSNRLVRTDFFKSRVDGWLSLSGGRLGGSPGRAPNFGPGRAATAGAAPVGAPGSPAAGFAAAAAALREPPASDFSFIFATGEREMDDKGIPETSAWAGKYNCGPRRKAEEIVDTNAGYVYDSTRQNPPNPSWGLLPAPGKAEVYIYPDCSDGLLVADVVRLGKGHTEGLEPKVTEELVKLMVSAKSGKMHSF